jgi:HK97 family phage major capsid protein
MNEQELRDGLAYVRSCLTDMHKSADGRPLTDDEQRAWDEGVAYVEETDRSLKAITERRAQAERLAAMPAHVESGDGALGAPQVMRRVEAFDGSDVRSLSRMEARDKALKVADSKEHTRHLSDDQREQVDRLLRTRTPDFDGTHVAKSLLLTESEDYRTGWQKLVTQVNPVLTAEEARAINDFQEFRAMSGNIDTAGGYGVPILIDPTVILTAQGSLNPFRKISRVETITTDAWRGVSSAGVTWSYDAEGTPVSDDSPTVAQPIVDVHQAQGFIPFSIRVGQDYPGFADEMSKLLMEGYDELQAQSFATGTGSGQPFGIITALDSNTNVEVRPTTAGTYDGSSINKVWSALPDRYKANATFVMSYAIANDTAVFANANNWSYFTVDLTGQIEQIRNRPVEFSSYFPGSVATTGTANILVVGDFRNYLIAERVGMSVEFIPHLFQQATAGSGVGMPTGQRGWFAYARHGADSVNDLGFRLLGQA